MRVTAVTVPNTPWAEMWLRFGARARELAADRLDVRLHIRAELGSEEVTLSGLRRGRIEMGGFSLQGLASVVPELNVLMAPFLFESVDEIDFVLDRHLTPIFGTLLRERGLALLRWAEVGWVHLYAREPLKHPDRVRGRRMRTSTALAQREFARAFGMDGIALPFTEVLPALQTGLVEGGQSGSGMYALAGLAREAPVLTRTYHAFDTGLVVANLAWWERLASDRRALIDACLESAQESRNLVRDAIARFEQELIPGIGGRIVDLDESERQAWRRDADFMRRSLIEAVGGHAAAVHAAIVEGKRAYAASAATSSQVSEPTPATAPEPR